MIARHVLLLVGPGQSNEYGAGEEPDYNITAGCPVRDPGYPNGTTTRSMWPRVAALAGQNGTWLAVWNGAVGSTSGADTWCGRCRVWFAGIVVYGGSYILHGGSVYKCTATTGGVPIACTVAPAAGVGADGATWVLARVAIAEDTDGHVYDMSSALFDPLGYFANTVAGVAAYSNAAWDLMIGIISIGQGDKTMGVTRAQYAQAMQNAALKLLSAGLDRVYIGFTCYGATAGLTAWYDAHLVPGRDDALAALSGNAGVRAGANLYAELGTLPVSPALRETPGLKPDLLHMNNSALALASQAWADALIADGAI